MANVFKLERTLVSSDLFSSSEAIAKFGKPSTNPALCEVSKRMVRIDSPFRLKLYARKSTQFTSKIGCHKIVAPHMLAALHMIREKFSDKEIEALGLNVYAGCYNPRPIRNGTEWSKHAFAIATDWLPAENGLHTPFAKSTFGRPEYKEYLDIWQMCGFANLGRLPTFGRDSMHMEFMKTADESAKKEG